MQSQNPLIQPLGRYSILHFFPTLSHLGIFFSPGPERFGLDDELSWVCFEGPFSKFGGGGKSVACAMIDGSNGAGRSERFRDSSSNRSRRTEDGLSWSSVRLRSRTFGSDTLRSRFGGD